MTEAEWLACDVPVRRVGCLRELGTDRRADGRSREAVEVVERHADGLTVGQEADATQAEGLIEGLPIEAVIGDKGYDSARLVRVIEARGAKAVIPPCGNRTQQREYDEEQYEDRNLVDRFWQEIEQFRRVATRYEETARNFLAFVHLASIMVLLE